MADSMVERVGEAIATALDSRAYGLYDYSSYKGDRPPHVVRYEPTGAAVFRSSSREKAEAEWKRLNKAFVAQAAIEAMREPTEGMISACAVLGPTTSTVKMQRNAVRRDYTAMIEAALSDGERTP